MNSHMRRISTLCAILLVSLVACRDGGGAMSPTGVASPAGSEAPRVGQTPPAGAPWYEAYLEEERRAPVFDGELNGIRIGPSVVPSGPCRLGESREVAGDAATGTAVEIRPAYLPPQTSEVGSSASVCAGQTAVAVREYVLAPHPEGAPSGGRVTIVRRLGSHEVPLQQAATRASAATVLGRPAVAFRPLTPEGWGPSALVIAEPWGTTTLQATGLPAAELERIAEGLPTVKALCRDTIECPPPALRSRFIQEDGFFRLPRWDDRNLSDEEKARNPWPDPFWPAFIRCMQDAGIGLTITIPEEATQEDVDRLVAEVNASGPAYIGTPKGLQFQPTPASEAFLKCETILYGPRPASTPSGGLTTR